MEFKVGEWYEGEIEDVDTGETYRGRVRCIASDVPELELSGAVFVTREGGLGWEQETDDETLKHLPGCTGWDWKPWTPPEPGEGWRLLAAGEVTTSSDEYWDTTARKWQRCFGGTKVEQKDLIDPANCCSYWARRRVEPAKPCVPTGWVQVGGISGGMLWFAPDDASECAPISAQAENTGESVLWRELEQGETIREGDETADVSFGRKNAVWVPFDSHNAGRVVDRTRFPSHVYRRRVRVESPGWRYLDEGETVLAGDECRATYLNNWGKCRCTVGDTVLRSSADCFRRKISPV